ncbi:MAG: RNA polymerase sigma factor [Myxococcaceae bacterium]|jgi:RNA polymerase sigma-70 factor (ECF subfamily)|nr:RNA polymerase sigma factor [Myxococcaceae bacterium]
MHAPTDASLVERARGGDEYAFDLLYRRHVQFVAAVVLRVCGRSSDLEDVVQETFIIAFDKLDTLVHVKALRGWLAQIAISRADRRSRWFRWLRLFRDEPDEKAALSSMVSTAAGPHVHAELRDIDAALAKVPEPERTAWLLRFGLGCTLEEVAQGLGCSLATAKRRLSLAHGLMGDAVRLEDDP